jgi:hypothetical protein
VRKRLSVDNVADGRETRESGKASHRGHGGHRGGNDVVRKRLSVDNVADGREKSEKENTGNQRPIAIEELSKSKAVRIKRLAGV